MIIHLTLDGLHSSPYLSQVLGTTVALQKAGADLRLAVWTRETPERIKSCREREAITRLKMGKNALFFRRGFNLGFYSVKSMARQMLAYVPRNEPLVFHARSAWAGLIALELKRSFPSSRVITDLRGAMEAEARMIFEDRSLPVRMMGRLWAMEAARAEATCVAESDHLLCVSKAFKNLLMERYGVFERRITVVPCFVDEGLFNYDGKKRNDAREALGIPRNACTFLYCGTLSHYNRNKTMMRLFQRARERSPRSVLLLITPDRETAREEATKAGIPGKALRILTGTERQVAAWLPAGDAAFLLRNLDEINRVACPIKFAEYARSGVKTLATHGIGDLTEFIHNRKAGWILDPFGNLPEDLTDPYGDVERSRLSQAAGEVFGRSRHLPAILKLYRDLTPAGTSLEARAF